MSHAKPAFVLTVLSKAEGSERFSFFTYTCLCLSYWEYSYVRLYASIRISADEPSTFSFPPR